jgi:hypothetical protein|tara:strand:- start:1002 stop:1397 length:396 start_codon:yes stop_codon:yes gene_type:complete
MSEEDEKSPYGKDGEKPKGFAANPHLINRGGRPKGSRNKSSLMKAQLAMDSWAEMAVDGLIALAENDTKKLGTSEKDNVPYSIRLAAMKELLAKSIANEKDKLGEKPKGKSEEKEEDNTPVVSSQPVKTVK